MRQIENGNRHRETREQAAQHAAYAGEMPKPQYPRTEKLTERQDWIASLPAGLCGRPNYGEGLLRDLLPFWIAGDYEGAYNRLAPVLDPEGFRLFWAAEQQTSINIYRAFPIEDSLGYFESMSGYAMLEWLEAEAFGTYDLETRAPGIQVVCKLKINKGSEQYQAYRNAIYEQAVKSMLKKEMTSI